ncbi:MAG: hypothetical protein A2Y25_09895 [Candidatus Melainabacteria bacterium GWF2_37_15]|nr:MAG: hypothetical protein A2Y25_09895 [Candidatus Melainabacteria bacterium GWF2_37_15]
MSSSYQKILKKIIDTEKRLKPNKQDISALMDYEINERNALLYQNEGQNEDIIEEYKNLKDNISAASMNNVHLAYQPIKVKPRRWSHQDF